VIIFPPTIISSGLKKRPKLKPRDFDEHIVGRFVYGSSTTSAIDLGLSKAFNRMNHYALLIKPIKRRSPTSNLYDILDSWFSNSWSCVKWLDTFPKFFKIELVVRQGSVLSPFFIAKYLDEIVHHTVSAIHDFMILYAVDISLLLIVKNFQV
jgi:Reverse transcriptase (RNA-dependent DNA polymerase)